MKKIVILIMLAIVSFSACKKNDNTDYAQQVSGIYKGTMTVKVEEGTVQVISSMKVSVTYVGFNAVSVKIDTTLNFTAGPQAYEIPLKKTFPATTTNGNEGRVLVTGTLEELLSPPIILPGPFHGEQGTLKLAFNGTAGISSQLIFSLKSPSGVTTLNTEFTGQKQ